MMFAKKSQPAIKSLIAQSSHIEGNISFADGLRIDGQVTGNVTTKPGNSSILVISETAVITGELHAEHIIINGVVTGPIYASRLLELQPKAQIVGDVFYAALELHQGALVTGQLHPQAANTNLEEFKKPTLQIASKSNKPTA
jgi:cytoskeletal protein CcmA (bactofilin family)